jgi:hypothetical protein
MDQRRVMSVAGRRSKPFDPQKMLEVIQAIENELLQARRFPARPSGE